MQEEILNSLSSLVPENYLNIAVDAKKGRENIFKKLIEKKKIPEEGLSEELIEEFLRYLSSLDNNNFPVRIGIGEREGRIYSGIVSRMNYGFAHGVGRSGSLTEAQPKAVGSTILARLTDALLLDLLRLAGIHSANAALLVPMATGMTMMLSILAIKQSRCSSKFALWSRIDQKSCFKAICTSGLTPVIIDTKLVGDELQTDLEEFRKQIDALGAENITCIISTTSCFAPRACDNIIELSKLSAEYNIPHLVNNAYGLQSTYITHQIEQAQRIGRIDIFIQSTDKNLMVPVSGCIAAGFDKSLIEKVANSYPGRASSAPALNVLVTLLALGRNKYLDLVKDRKQQFILLKEKLKILASKYGERVLETKQNPISLAFTLSSITDGNVPLVGSMLFKRGVSGARVISKHENKSICNHEFKGWGSHTSNIPFPYLTAAAAIGISSSEIDMFVDKLDKILQKLNKR